MTLLTVVQDVCAAVGVERPASVFVGINTNRTQQELLAVANETAQLIAYDTREWRQLHASIAIDGDGVATSFPLPANYKRLLLTSDVWRTTSSQIPMRFIPDHNEWLQRRLANYADSRGEWLLSGNNIWIAPILAPAQRVVFICLDKIALCQPAVSATRS